MDVDDDGSDQESLPEYAAAQAKREPLQKEMWQMRLFPYGEEMKQNADEYFSYIKTGLARACLHRDSRPGLIYYSQELTRFIGFYGRRFTKRDHILLVDLLYSALVAEKLDFSIVQVLVGPLVQLLCRKNLLKQEDITLPWRPLYKLYYEVAYKNLEEEGVLLLPENLAKSLEKVIRHANVFFAKEATQEILDEIRPFFCPFDDVFHRGLTLAYHFLPTCLTREQHQEFGAGLWFDEFWNWYAVADSSSHGETIFVQIFGKLAKDSPFFIDWSDKMDIIFGELVRSFKVNVSVEKVNVCTSTNVFSVIAPLLVYNMGGPNNIVQPYLDKLFRLLHTYFHPSNSGSHTQYLLMFILGVSNEIANRLYRERQSPKRHVIEVPQEYHLTNAHCDAYVKSILPCLEFAAFTKTKNEFCAPIFRVLSFISPGLVVPTVLDLIYPSLETVVEPHRLIQSLSILTGICIQLVRDDPVNTVGERRPLKNFESESPDSHLKSFRIHVIYLLERLLPAVDLNDAIKTTLAMQIIGLLLILVPVADCSEAVYIREDLTEEEKQLCSATARFDGIVDSLIGKLFSMIDIFGTNLAVNTHNTRQNLTKPRAKNIEELVMEKGIVAVIKTLLKNCSSAIYDKVLDFYYQYLQNAMIDSKPVLDTMRSLIPVFVINDAEKAFPLFFDYVYAKLKVIITDETLQEDEVDSSVIWFLNLFAEVVHEVPGKFLVARRTEIDALIDMGLHFKCKDAIGIMGRIINNCVGSLIAFIPQSPSHERRKKTNLADYLPIRHWAQSIDKNNWELKWYIPSDEEIGYAEHLVNKVVFYELDRLVEPAQIDKLSHNDLQKRLVFVRCALVGGSKFMPFFTGEPVKQFPTEPAGVYVDTVFTPKGLREIKSTDGRNLRLVVLERVQKLADYALTHRSDDTKSMIEIVNILRILILIRGIDEKTIQPMLNAYRTNKGNLSDPVKGPPANIEAVVEDSIVFLHLKRTVAKHSLSLKQQHIDVFRLLLRFSTSLYANVRVSAQKVLDNCFNSWARSYKFILDEILRFIHKDSTSTHEQLKGALHLLYVGKHRSVALRQDFQTILQVWPVLVNSHYSEKPSIVALMDNIHDLLIGSFASFEIYFNFPDDVLKRASALLEDYEGCVHPANYPGFDFLSTEDARSLEAKRNQENISVYYELIQKLCKAANDTSLHWRHIEMAQSLLSLLLRRDIEYPKEAVIIFTKLLSSDVIRARKTAIGIMSSWLKISKPKAIRQVLDVDKGENKPGAKWPIKYGLRADNVHLLFKTEDKIKTAEQWNNTVFHTKPYIGFYIWPKEYRAYASPSAQVNLNRDPSKFSPTEREVIRLLVEPTHLARFLKLLAVEEKKGSEQFNSASYSFFYGLARSFGTVFVDAVRPFVEELLANKEDASQRLAAELVAGILKGSKLWTYDKAKVLRDWLGPLLVANLNTMTTESEGLWAQALVSIFSDSEPRQTSWLYDLVMDLWKKSSVENSYHVSARLYFLHCAASQWEWRMVETWNQLFEICRPMLGQTLQNLRTRVAGLIADACQFESRHIYLMPGLEPRFKPIHFKTISEMVKMQVQKMSAHALERAGNSSQSDSDTEMADLTVTAPRPTTPTNDELTIKREKLVFLTYMTSLSVYTGCTIEPHVLEFLPILAHYSNDNKDEEMRNTCNLLLLHVMSIIPVEKKNMQLFLRTIAESLNRCLWWKARVALLKFLQVAVFSNIFIMGHAVDDICELLFCLLKDNQVEVRQAAADTLSGFIMCGYIPVDKRLVDSSNELTASSDPLEKHAGVLALSAIILAFPYTVPRFMPDILMGFCRFASSRQPIQTTVKKTLGEFKRTHQDCWHEHKLEFNEDQLAVLTNLLVSPNYYV